MNDLDDEPDPRTVTALADAAQLTGVGCRDCGALLCGHEAVFALVLGYKSAPRCLGCTAAHMRESAAGLRERTLSYVQHHQCFHTAWRHASEEEQVEDAERPACVWRTAPLAIAAPTVTAAAPAAAGQLTDAFWDAGSMGCGDLVLELRLRLTALPAGGVLELRAEDPGAPIDLPAWCTVTGHTMLEARHPTYRIRRKA